MHFTLNNTLNWINHIDKIVDKLNSRYHRTIRMSPKDAYLKKNEQKLKNIWKQINTREIGRPKFKVGDRVRLARHSELFRKGYFHTWTLETFRIHKVCKTIVNKQ